MLLRFLGSLVRSAGGSNSPASPARRVLDVGGYSKALPLPRRFRGWEHVLLDADARGESDVDFDARDLASLPPAQFDAVYCSHYLECHHRLDGVNVLRGFLHVLKPDGFAQVIVSDLQAVMQGVAGANVDLAKVLYRSPAGPIAVRDLIYGIGDGVDHSVRGRYAHKTEFTPQSLCKTLAHVGFPYIHSVVAPESFEITALAFKSLPTTEQRTLLNLPAA